MNNILPKTWHKLSIKKKLMLFFSILILSVIFLFFYILNNAFGYLKIYEDDLIKTSLVYNLSGVIKDNKMNFDNVIRSYSKDNIDIFEASIGPVWISWNNVKNKVNTSQDAFYQIEAIRFGMLAFIDSAKLSINSIKNNQEVFTEQLIRAGRIENYIVNYLDLLINVRLNESSRLHENQKEAVSKIQGISFIGIVLIGLISLIFVNFFSFTLTKPIIDLAANTQKMADGILNVKSVSAQSDDEIGVLTNSFNKMSHNIHEMVESLKDKAKMEKLLYEDEMKIVDMGKSLKEAQFLSLQSQINPHFLFNTLNTIARTSMFEQAPKTVRLIECLSSVFRYNLNNQEKAVTLKEELEILKEYMFIQKSRYGDRISFKIENELDVSCIRIPVFTLQPLVENAVKYGIEPKEEGGSITICIEKEEMGILIKVIDTGVGFDTQMIDLKKHQKKSTGIGLSNVKKRLSLKFNGLERFTINSVINKGTEITIFLPEQFNV
ncbi:MAG: histidine kinase [Spirochaetaceae bacterium]|jgi:two-component system sensor histidine kinase YesM|nr:histidine kinase [Spirochaetaceae bacterium]